MPQNSRTRRLSEPMTISADATAWNGATATTCRGLHVQGLPTICLNVGSVGVSATGISFMAYAQTTYGVTPTALSVGGSTDGVLLSVEECLHRIRLDNPLTETQTLVVSVSPRGDSAIVSPTVVDEAPTGGVSDLP